MDEETIEVWLIWNDGKRRKPSSPLNGATKYYVGMQAVNKDGASKIRWVDVTHNPHLPEMVAVADLIGECDESKAFSSIPWSNSFPIPKAWIEESKELFL